MLNRVEILCLTVLKANRSLELLTLVGAAGTTLGVASLRDAIYAASGVD
jgi:hypothetical protein